jgi:hypothetical protein
MAGISETFSSESLTVKYSTMLGSTGNRAVSHTLIQPSWIDSQVEREDRNMVTMHERCGRKEHPLCLTFPRLLFYY